MAQKKGNSIGWGSHLPVLIHLVGITDGPILELGMGLYSTPFLHWACLSKKRPIVSYDKDITWFSANKRYENSNHKVFFTDDWETIEIEKPWDIVFIDLNPVLKRKDMAAKVANHAKFVVLHDSQDDEYKYSEIYPLFKFRLNYTKALPNTVILSNTVDLTNIKI